MSLAGGHMTERCSPLRPSGIIFLFGALRRESWQRGFEHSNRVTQATEAAQADAIWGSGFKLSALAPFQHVKSQGVRPSILTRQTGPDKNRDVAACVPTRKPCVGSSLARDGLLKGCHSVDSAHTDGHWKSVLHGRSGEREALCLSHNTKTTQIDWHESQAKKGPFLYLAELLATGCCNDTQP